MTDQRHTITLADKQTIIKTSKIKPKTVDLVKHFDNKYRYFTIHTILKDKISNAIGEGVDGKRANLKGAKYINFNLIRIYPQLELALWIESIKKTNKSIESESEDELVDIKIRP
jgi:hypothetical protein